MGAPNRPRALGAGPRFAFTMAKSVDRILFLSGRLVKRSPGAAAFRFENPGASTENRDTDTINAKGGGMMRTFVTSPRWSGLPA